MNPQDSEIDEILYKFAEYIKHHTRTGLGGENNQNWAKKQIKLAVLRGKREELNDVRFKHSRTYDQKVTDRNGAIYVEDSHSFISSYEVQERIAELDKQIKEIEEA